jgi:hypothetical protein
MLKSSLIIHVLAVFAVVSGVMKLREDSLMFRKSHNLASINPESEPPVAKTPLTASQPSPRLDWTEIASRDPFSFDRNDIPIVMKVETSKPRAPKPLLYGTMIVGDSRIALLGPNNAAGRGSLPVRLGEEMEGWKVIQIDDRSVLVEANTVQETLVINDPTAQIPRSQLKTLINTPQPSLPPPPPAVSSSVTSEPAKADVASGIRDTPAAPKRTHVIQTPFGPKVMEDSPQ